MNDPRVDQIPKAPAGGSVGKSDSCESLEVTGGCVTAPGQRQGDSGQRREKSEQAKKECNVPRKKMDSGCVCSLAVLGGVCVCEDYTERRSLTSAVTIAYQTYTHVHK